jgi:hypothetical protein
MANLTLTNPLAAATPGSVALDELGYGDVVLLDGRARKQAQQTLDAVIGMDDDALLRPFRAAAGMAVSGPALGGWYDADPSFDPPGNLTGYIPGHSFGQYLSALARGYAVSGDQRARQKVERLVAAYAPTVSPRFYKNYPIPAYTYDKLMIGLIDAFRFTGNRQALDLIAPTTDAVLPFLPGRALDRAETQANPKPNMAFGWDETYTLAENLYLAAEIGAGTAFARWRRAICCGKAISIRSRRGAMSWPGATPTAMSMRWPRPCAAICTRAIRRCWRRRAMAWALWLNKALPRAAGARTKPLWRPVQAVLAPVWAPPIAALRPLAVPMAISRSRAI